MPGALGTSALPFWPALLFSYLEPISLLIGAHAATTSPSTFVSAQLPSHGSMDPMSPPVIVLAYTLGSLFFILSGYALICTVFTKDATVTKYYLLVAACGDVGHLVANYAGMDSKVFWGWREWNEVMWGNIAITIFLLLNRLATVCGFFGTPGWNAAGKVKTV